MNSFSVAAERSLATLLITAHAAFAINNVAVLELLHNESVLGEIKIEESRHLTDELRKQAVMSLPVSGYSVLTRDNIIALIPPDEEEAECLAASCAVEIGRAIGAEYVSQGRIGRFGSKLTISVELYETMGGKLLSGIVFESDNIEGLLDVIRKEAKPFFQSILSESEFSGLKNSQNKPPNSTNSVDSINSGYSDSDKGNKESGGFGLPQWLGIGIAAAGIGIGIYGVSQNSEYKKLHNDFKSASDDFDARWQNVEAAKGRRNLGYIIGGALLAGGIGVFFVF